MNSIVLMGRLTADPEIRMTKNDVKVCRFSVAVQRPHTKDKTDFFNCLAWRQTADFIENYFSKGKMICLQGYLQNSSYTDRQGNKKTAAEIMVSEVNFCGDKESKKEEKGTLVEQDLFGSPLPWED